MNTYNYKTNIFIKCDQLSYDQVKQSIPDDAQTTPLTNWVFLNKIEWRWRFMVLPDKPDHRIVEISKMTPFSINREFVKPNGEWVFRKISGVYDDYVTEQYFYYTDF